MATTYLKGSSGDTLQWQGNLTVDGTQVFTGGTSYAGDVTLGDSILDTTILKGRMTTGSVAGTALDLGATYLYNQLFELRGDVSNWTGMADNFTGAYLRFSTSTKTTSYNLTGMELNVASTAAVVNLSGLYSETQCKALAAGSTWTKVKGVEANLSFYDQTQTVAVTEAMCFYATIGLGSGYTAYTGIHGLIIETRDGSVGTRTLGSGIILRNITPAEGTQTFTKGIQIAMACTTGISLEGAMIAGFTITGTVTNGIDLTGATLTQAVDNALFSIGSYSAAKSVTVTDNYIPFQVNLVSIANPGSTSTMSAAYLKVATTTADQANTQLVGATVRVGVGKNVDSAYGVQSHLNITETVAAGTVNNLTAASFNTDVTNTKVATGTVSALLLGTSGAGTVTGLRQLILASVAAEVTDCDSIMRMEFGGTVTNVFEVMGVTSNLTNLIYFQNAAGPVGAAVTVATGSDKSIRVDVAGTPYYIPLYDSLSA